MQEELLEKLAKIDDATLERAMKEVNASEEKKQQAMEKIQEFKVVLDLEKAIKEIIGI